MVGYYDGCRTILVEEDEKILENGLSIKELEILEQLLHEEIRILEKTKSLSRSPIIRNGGYVLRLSVEKDLSWR